MSAVVSSSTVDSVFNVSTPDVGLERRVHGLAFVSDRAFLLTALRNCHLPLDLLSAASLAWLCRSLNFLVVFSKRHWSVIMRVYEVWPTVSVTFEFVIAYNDDGVSLVAASPLHCARSVVSSLSSSKTMCQLNECAQPSCQCRSLQTSEMKDTHVHFIRSMPPTYRSEPNKLQNLHKHSAAGLSRNKNHNVN